MNSKFDSKDFFGLLAIVLIFGLIAFFGSDSEISGDVAVNADKLYGGSSSGFIVPLPKIYGGAIYKLHGSQFSGKASGSAVRPPLPGIYSDQLLGSVCPEGYGKIRIEEAQSYEESGFEVVLPGGAIGMNRFACAKRK